MTGIAQHVAENFVNENLNNSLRDDSSFDLADNIHYGPNLQQPFIDFMVKIPLFSNIMNRAFGSTNMVATSGATEVGFNTFKNHIFQHKTGTRVDKIVEKHLEFLQGSLKPFNTNKYKGNAEARSDDENEKKCDKVPEEFLSQVYEENWRNKNVDAKLSKESLHRSKASILNPKRPFPQYVPILKNGHRVIGTKSTIGVLLTQTCPFDSLFQIFATCYADNSLFANKVRDDESDLSELLQNIFIPDYDAYKQRNKILLELFPEKAFVYGRNQGRDIMRLDCEMGIHDMFRKLFMPFPVIQNFQQSIKCASCSFESAKNGKPYVSNDLNALDFKNIQQSITFNNISSRCPICKAELTTRFDMNDVISIDVEVTAADGIIHSVNIPDMSKFVVIF